MFARSGANVFSPSAGLLSAGRSAGNLEATVVPEPSTLGLALIGSIWLAILVFRRRRLRLLEQLAGNARGLPAEN
jgi:hypothetical protein